jgi:hypothetical protein
VKQYAGQPSTASGGAAGKRMLTLMSFFYTLPEQFN